MFCVAHPCNVQPGTSSGNSRAGGVTRACRLIGRMSPVCFPAWPRMWLLMTLLTRCLKPSVINFLCILIECRWLRRLNKLISAGSAPADVLSPPDWMNYSACFEECGSYRSSHPSSRPNASPFLCCVLNAHPLLDSPTPLPCTSVWKNVGRKQLAVLWPFLQTPLLPNLPHILPSLQTCDAFFFSVCTVSFTGPAEVIFCYCGI